MDNLDFAEFRLCRNWMLQNCLSHCAYVQHWYLKDSFCTLFFRPRTCPRAFLQSFALYFLCSKAKDCRNVLGRVLGRKNKVHAPSFTLVIINETDQSSWLYSTSHETTSDRMSTYCPTYITAISLHLTSHKTRKPISKGFHSFAKHIPWVTQKQIWNKGCFLKNTKFKSLIVVACPKESIL